METNMKLVLGSLEVQVYNEEDADKIKLYCDSFDLVLDLKNKVRCVVKVRPHNVDLVKVHIVFGSGENFGPRFMEDAGMVSYSPIPRGETLLNYLSFQFLNIPVSFDAVDGWDFDEDYEWDIDTVTVIYYKLLNIVSNPPEFEESPSETYSRSLEKYNT